MKDAEYADLNMADDVIISRANKRVQANNLAAIRQQQLAAKEQPGYIAPSEVKNTINKVINTLKTNLEKEIQVNPLKQEWQKRQEINKLGLEIDNFVKNVNVNKILQNKYHKETSYYE